jgi:hypothetical protein
MSNKVKKRKLKRRYQEGGAAAGGGASGALSMLGNIPGLMDSISDMTAKNFSEREDKGKVIGKGVGAAIDTTLGAFGIPTGGAVSQIYGMYGSVADKIFGDKRYKPTYTPSGNTSGFYQTGGTIPAESEAKGFVKNWLNHPASQQRAAGLGLDPRILQQSASKLDTIPFHDNAEQVKSLYGNWPSNLPETTRGFYNPGKNYVYLKPREDEKEVIGTGVHESLHGTGLDAIMQSFVPDYKPEKVDDPAYMKSYFDRNETYPRIMKMRYMFGLTPDKQVSADEVKSMREKSTDEIFKMFDDAQISEMLNKFVVNDQQSAGPQSVKVGGLTQDKAREILHDGTVHGNKITDKQRRYFGAVASGYLQEGGITEDYFDKLKRYNVIQPNLTIEQARRLPALPDSLNSWRDRYIRARGAILPNQAPANAVTIKTINYDVPVVDRDTIITEQVDNDRVERDRLFAQARKAGQKTFTYKGKVYSTEMGTNAPAPVRKPNMTIIEKQSRVPASALTKQQAGGMIPDYQAEIEGGEFIYNPKGLDEKTNFRMLDNTGTRYKSPFGFLALGQKHAQDASAGIKVDSGDAYIGSAHLGMNARPAGKKNPSVASVMLASGGKALAKGAEKSYDRYGINKFNPGAVRHHKTMLDQVALDAEIAKLKQQYAIPVR